MQIEPIIVLGPLVAALIAGLLQKQIGDKVAMAITTGALCLSAVLSIYTFADFFFAHAPERVIELAPFISVDGFTSTWSIRIDALSAIMLVVVTGVSSLVHIYSIGYMAEDPHKARFFSYLSFFTFAMLALVTANDFLQMFFGWEGVGVASYLLIGFWYEKRSANDAAIKAFVVNRVGDFGFALGIMACYWAYGSIRFDEVFAAAAAHKDMVFTLGGFSAPMIEVVCTLLFIGAMGKSAQFFLHVWLPDAMEGPTPVSALIHAATMVTAGVFMVCRCSSMYELAPQAAGIVTIVGATTALFAATVGLAQNDIKRVVAYSTCSQLGYMFFAAGAGAYNAAMFHLFTHAAFKALLFLGSGSVILGLHHEQDMRQMGGVRKKMPITFWMMLIGTLALIGIGIPGTPIGLAGFFSKDAAIEAAYVAGEQGRIGGELAFWVGVGAAFLTSFYSWRLLFMTFEGKFRGGAHGHGHDDHGEEGAPEPDAHAHDAHGHGHAVAAPADGTAPAHESPWVMLGPLVVLAFGAVFLGVAFAPYFLGEHAHEFWRDAIALKAHEGEEHHPPAWVLWAPVIATVSGFLLCLPVYFFSQTAGAKIAKATGPLHAFLYHKWFFDEIYDFIFVKGARAIGDVFWKTGDQKIIDGVGPNGTAWLAKFTGRQVRKAQTGYVYHYSFLMLAGIVGFGAFALWWARALG
jgi:NADH-quinone oxidoreductase subunit L